MSLFSEYIPWRHVCMMLGMPSSLARYYVNKKEVRTKPNPYSPVHLLYNVEDVQKLKEWLRNPLTAVRGKNGDFMKWERKES